MHCLKRPIMLNIAELLALLTTLLIGWLNAANSDHGCFSLNLVTIRSYKDEDVGCFEYEVTGSNQCDGYINNQTVFDDATTIHGPYQNRYPCVTGEKSEIYNEIIIGINNTECPDLNVDAIYGLIQDDTACNVIIEPFDKEFEYGIGIKLDFQDKLFKFKLCLKGIHDTNPGPIAFNHIVEKQIEFGQYGDLPGFCGEIQINDNKLLKIRNIRRLLSSDPTHSPSTDPTGSPSTDPTHSPSTDPTHSPSTDPTVSPSTDPTGSPSTDPTVSPSTDPTVSSSTDPTVSPSTDPTGSPSTDPTCSPSVDPTQSPSVYPTQSPSISCHENKFNCIHRTQRAPEKTKIAETKGKTIKPVSLEWSHVTATGEFKLELESFVRCAPAGGKSIKIDDDKNTKEDSPCKNKTYTEKKGRFCLYNYPAEDSNACDPEKWCCYKINLGTITKVELYITRFEVEESYTSRKTPKRYTKEQWKAKRKATLQQYRDQVSAAAKAAEKVLKQMTKEKNTIAGHHCIRKARSNPHSGYLIKDFQDNCSKKFKDLLDIKLKAITGQHVVILSPDMDIVDFGIDVNDKSWKFQMISIMFVLVIVFSIIYIVSMHQIKRKKEVIDFDSISDDTDCSEEENFM